MARIEYNILDEELLALLEAFNMTDIIETVGGIMVVPSSMYDAYLDQIEQKLIALDDYENPLWDTWSEIDNNTRVWSTDRGIWVD